MNFDNWLILFIDPQLEGLAGGVSQFDVGADIFGWHLKQRGIDGDGGIKDTLESAKAMDGEDSDDVKALTQLLEHAENERQSLGKQASRVRLTARQRQARESLIDLVLDQRKLGRLHGQMDDQTYELMREVFTKLSDDFELTPGQQEAINRLQ